MHKNLLDGRTVTDRCLSGVVVRVLGQNVRGIGFNSHLRLKLFSHLSLRCSKEYQIIINYSLLWYCVILQYFNAEFLQTAMWGDRKGASICNPFGGSTECGSARKPSTLSVGKVQKHLRDHLFHEQCKQLCNSMHYLYNDPGIVHPQLKTLAHKAESEQEDRPRKGV